MAEQKQSGLLFSQPYNNEIADRARIGVAQTLEKNYEEITAANPDKFSWDEQKGAYVNNEINPETKEHDIVYRPGQMVEAAEREFSERKELRNRWKLGEYADESDIDTIRDAYYNSLDKGEDGTLTISDRTRNFEFTGNTPERNQELTEKFHNFVDYQYNNTGLKISDAFLKMFDEEKDAASKKGVAASDGSIYEPGHAGKMIFNQEQHDFTENQIQGIMNNYGVSRREAGLAVLYANNALPEDNMKAFEREWPRLSKAVSGKTLAAEQEKKADEKAYENYDKEWKLNMSLSPGFSIGNPYLSKEEFLKQRAANTQQEKEKQEVNGGFNDYSLTTVASVVGGDNVEALTNAEFAGKGKKGIGTAFSEFLTNPENIPLYGIAITLRRSIALNGALQRNYQYKEYLKQKEENDKNGVVDLTLVNPYEKYANESFGKGNAYENALTYGLRKQFKELDLKNEDVALFFRNMDDDMIRKAENDFYENQIRGTSLGYDVSSVTLQSLSFMADFFLSMGATTGIKNGFKAVVKAGAKEASKEVAEQAALTAGKKSLIGTFKGAFEAAKTANLASGMSEEAARQAAKKTAIAAFRNGVWKAAGTEFVEGAKNSLFLLPGYTAKFAAQRNMSGIVDLDDNGNIVFNPEHSLTEDIYGGIFSAQREILSESMGAFFSPIGKGLTRGVSHVPGFRALSRAAGRMRKRILPNAVMNTLRKNFNYQGVFGEMGEERIADLEDVITGWGEDKSAMSGNVFDRFGKSSLNPFSKDSLYQYTVEGLSFTASPIVMNEVSKTANYAFNKRYRMERAEDAIVGKFRKEYAKTHSAEMKNKTDNEIRMMALRDNYLKNHEDVLITREMEKNGTTENGKTFYTENGLDTKILADKARSLNKEFRDVKDDNAIVNTLYARTMREHWNLPESMSDKEAINQGNIREIIRQKNRKLTNAQVEDEAGLLAIAQEQIKYWDENNKAVKLSDNFTSDTADIRAEIGEAIKANDAMKVRELYVKLAEKSKEYFVELTDDEMKEYIDKAFKEAQTDYQTNGKQEQTAEQNTNAHTQTVTDTVNNTPEMNVNPAVSSQGADVQQQQQTPVPEQTVQRPNNTKNRARPNLQNEQESVVEDPYAVVNGDETATQMQTTTEQQPNVTSAVPQTEAQTQNVVTPVTSAGQTTAAVDNRGKEDNAAQTGTSSKEHSFTTSNRGYKDGNKIKDAAKDFPFDAHEVSVDEMSGEVKEKASALKELAAILSGKDVVFFDYSNANDAEKNKNRFGIHSKGIIFFPINALENDRNMVKSFGHEWFHSLKTDRKTKPLFDAMIEAIKAEVEQDGKLKAAFESRLATYKEDAGTRGKEFSRERGYEEFSADTLGRFLSDAEFMKRIITRVEGKHPGFAKRIFESIKRAFEQLMSMFKGKVSSNSEFFTQERLNRIEQVFESAIADAVDMNLTENAENIKRRILSNSDKVESLPVSELNIDPKRFQFKSNVNRTTGVDESNQIGGEWNPKAAGNIYVWEDKSGKKFVVNGHHRFQLAKENHREFINANVDREVDGVTAEQARRNGTILNIIDEKGDVRDYAEFVRGDKMDEDTAKKMGILAREKGRLGFVIGKYATDNLYATFRAGDIGEIKAATIADIARGDDGLEVAGLHSAKRMSNSELRTHLQYLKTRPRKETSNNDGWLFDGFDDSEIKHSEAMSKLALKHINAIDEQLRAVRSAINHPETAKKGDVFVGKNAEKVFNDTLKMKQEWENWITDENLNAQLERELDDAGKLKASSEQNTESVNDKKGEKKKKQNTVETNPVEQKAAEEKQVEEKAKETEKKPSLEDKFSEKEREITGTNNKNVIFSEIPSRNSEETASNVKGTSVDKKETAPAKKGKSLSTSAQKKMSKAGNDKFIEFTNRYRELKNKEKSSKNSGEENLDSELDEKETDELNKLGFEIVYLLMDEGGLRSISDIAQVFVEQFGDDIRPNIKYIYMSAKHSPKAEKYRNEMDSESVVDAFDVNQEFTDDADDEEQTTNTGDGNGEREEIVKPQEQTSSETGSKDSPRAERTGAKIDVDQVRNGQSGVSDGVSALTAGVSNRGGETAGRNGTKTEDGGGQGTGSAEQGRESVGRGRSSDVVGAGRRTGDSVHDAGGRDKETVSGVVEGKLRGHVDVGLAHLHLSNHRIQKGDTLFPAGKEGKYQANISAIRLLKRLESENRAATEEECRTLAQYTGWGSISEFFNEGSSHYAELKELLNEEEFKKAMASTTTAFYTDPDIIRTMWNMAENLGYQGGNVGELGAGVGHFLGLVPEKLSGKAKFTAVEMDNISGRIVKKLYPSANVSISALQDVKLKNDSLRMVIGNFPFSQIGTSYNNQKFTLHNYFFARALDAVKPGGLVIALTSSGTMDDSDIIARRYLSAHAELVAAYRLPNNAFKGAGTQAVSDIIILRKKAQEDENAIHPFVNRAQVETLDGSGKANVNEYFAAHPENVLGDLSNTGNFNSLTVIPSNAYNFKELLNKRAEELKKSELKSATNTAVEEDSVIDAIPLDQQKEGAMVFKDGKLYVHSGIHGDTEAKDKKGNVFNNSQINRARHYMGIRDTLLRLLDTMANTDDEQLIKRLQRELNAKYDAFVRETKANFITMKNNGVNFFIKHDPSFVRVASLENMYEVNQEDGTKKQVIAKADIFNTRTLKRHVAPSKAENVKEGLNLSIMEYGRIDLSYISKLTGVDESKVKDALLNDGLCFIEPNTDELIRREDYLCGNIAQKIVDATERAKKDESFQKNIDALKEVLPAPKKINEIGFRLGARWMPISVINSWIKDEFGVTASVSYEKSTDSYSINCSNKDNVQKYRAGNRNAIDILENALNLKETRASKWDNSEQKMVLDPEATQVAHEYRRLMNQDFCNYVIGNKEIADKVADIYNRVINVNVEKGKELLLPAVLPGMADTYNGKPFALREHQRAAVSRCMNGNTLLAHCVGSGKTITMIAAAMELKRLRKATKSLIVVQNSTLMQFASSAQQLYPGAKILVAGKDDLVKGNRELFLGKVMNNDWDIVIMAQSSFDRMKLDNADIAKYFNKMLDELEVVIKEKQGEMGKESRQTVKQLQNKQASLRSKMDELIKANRTDSEVSFNELGFDALFMDEAHAYKKNFFVTAMSRVRGLDTGFSARSTHLTIIMDNIREKTGNRNLYFATGTPITNTLAEVWNMVRYMNPEVLRDFHAETFDQFAAQFTEVTDSFEMTAGGTFKNIARFSKFTNVEDVHKMFAAVSDIVMEGDLKDVQRPKMKGGKPQNILVERGNDIAKFMEYLNNLYKWYDNLSGDEKKSNMALPLLIFGMARKATTDLRLIDAHMPDDKNSKLNAVANMVAKKYHEYKYTKAVNGEDPKILNGTQAVFLDCFSLKEKIPGRKNFITGKTSYTIGGELFNAHQEIKRKLIEKGIPEKEIAIINDYNTDEKKNKLFAAVNAGTVRVIIGSTQKLGVGVNIQERLCCLHNVDAAYLPADMEQRQGRIIRQGNMIAEPEVFNYAVSKTLDATIYQMLARKKEFIDAVISGKITGSVEVEDDQNLSGGFAEFAALISGDSRVMELAQLDKEIKELEAFQENYAKRQQEMSAELSDSRSTIDRRKKDIEATKAFIEKYGDTSFKEMSGNINGTEFKTDRNGFVQLFNDLMEKHDKDIAFSFNLEINGLPIMVRQEWNEFKKEFMAAYEVNAPELDTVKATSFSYTQSRGEFPSRRADGFLSSLSNLINKKANEVKQSEQSIQESNNNIANIQKEMARGTDTKKLNDLIAKRLELRHEIGDTSNENRVERKPDLKNYGLGKDVSSDTGDTTIEEDRSSFENSNEENSDYDLLEQEMFDLFGTITNTRENAEDADMDSDSADTNTENNEANLPQSEIANILYAKNNYAQLLSEMKRIHKFGDAENYLSEFLIDFINREKYKQFRGENGADFMTFVTNCARNFSVSGYRKETAGKRDPNNPMKQDSIQDQQEGEKGTDIPDNSKPEYLAKETNAFLNMIKDSLPGSWFGVYQDSVVGGMTHGELAEKYGKTIDQIRYILKSVPVKAKEMLEAEGYHKEDFFDNELEEKDVVEKKVSALNFTVSLFKMLLGKNVITNAKKDLSVYDMLFNLPTFYAGKILALKEVYKAVEEKSEQTNMDFNMLVTNEDGENVVTMLEKFKSRSDKKVWDSFSRYLVEKDRNGSPFRVVESGNGEDAKYTIYKGGKAEKEEYDNRDEAWEEVFQREYNDLQKAGMGNIADMVLEWRHLFLRSWEYMFNHVNQEMKAVKKRGISGKEVEDVMGETYNAIEKEGELVGSYFPRMRDGEYFAVAEKGKERVRIGYQLNTMAQAKVIQLKAAGWTDAHVEKNDKLPDTIISQIKHLSALYQEIQNALSRIEPTEKDFNAYGIGVTVTMVGDKSNPNKQKITFDLALEGKERNPVADRFMINMMNKEDVNHYSTFCANSDEVKKVLKFVYDGITAGKTDSKDGAKELSIQDRFSEAYFKQMDVSLLQVGFGSHRLEREDAIGDEVTKGYEEDPIQAAKLYLSGMVASKNRTRFAKRFMSAITGSYYTFEKFIHENHPEMETDKESLKKAARSIVIRSEWLKAREAHRLDSTKQVKAYNDAMATFETVMRHSNVVDRFFGIANGITAAKMLSSPSSAFNNSIAMATTVPWVLKKYTESSILDVFPAILRGEVAYLRYYNWGKFGTGSKLSDHDMKVFDIIHNCGWDGATLTAESLRTAGTWGFDVLHKGEKALMYLFGFTEMLNRGTTIKAAYDLLESKLKKRPETDMEIKELLDKAKEISDKAHGDYTKTNDPYILKNSLGRALSPALLFSKYGRNLLAQMLDGGFFNKKNIGSNLMMFLSMSVTGGVKTTGITIAMVKLICWMINLFGLNVGGDDPEEAFYRTLEKLIGVRDWGDDTPDGATNKGFLKKTGSRFVRRGITGALGIDMSNSLAAFDFIKGVPEDSDDWLNLIGGAPVSMARQAGKAIRNISYGNVWLGAEQLMPRLFANPMRAVREKTEGVSTENGNPVYYGKDRLKLSWPGMVERSFGFNPMGYSERRERQWKAEEIRRNYTQMRTDIYNRMRVYIIHAKGNDIFNRPEWIEIMRDVEEYNARIKRNNYSRVDVTPIEKSTIKQVIKKTRSIPKRELMRGKK